MCKLSIVVALAAAIGVAGGAQARGMSAMPGMNMFSMDMGHHHDENGAERLGKVSFPTSCTRSQAAMERGVALLHSFGYAKAQMQFEAVTRDDPGCAMAHWGVAMTQYQELWSQPDDAALKLGANEMTKARALAGTATPREKAYIDALSAFFTADDASFQTRADAYQAKMNAVHTAFPGDVEAAAFDALAILASTPPTDTSLTHARQALAILQPLFKAHPEHPGLAHYIIHTCDTPALAREGLAAARAYARIAPASPHALHMPAHIFARLGMWREDIASNLASAKASNAAEKAHEPGAAHQLHADEFLIYAYLQTGDDDKSRRLADNMGALGMRMAAMPGMDDMKDSGHYFDNELRVIYRLETHDWKGLTTIQPAPGAADFETFPIYWGRGVAAGHLGDAKGAAEALAGFDRSLEAVKTSPYAAFVPALEIQRNEILGWKAYADGKPDEAIADLRMAADTQDKLGQGEVDIPAREMLADLLLALHRPTEALTEYRVALTLSPNRLNGLIGAAHAAEAAGQKRAARGYYATAARQTGFGKHSHRPELAQAVRKAGLKKTRKKTSHA